MQISHKVIDVAGEQKIYLYVKVEDIYEFGKENFGDGKDTNFLKNIRKYAKKNLKEFSKAGIVIVINGVILGTITLSAIMPKYNKSKNINENLESIGIYNEQKVDIYNEEKTEIDKEDKQKEQQEQQEQIVNEKEESKKDDIKNNVVKSTATATTKKTSNTSNVTSNKTTNKNNTNNTTNKSNTTSTKKPATSTPTTVKPTTTTTTTTKPAETNKQEDTKVETGSKVEKEETVTYGRTIRFNNNGVISNIDLEEYVIGVVAAEMPASFNIEALKAQAVVARTYAMKKHSSGVTLVNSTSHQVYNSVDQMKAKWGSSFNTYYTKVKNAVNATKGKVLKYNGSYIEALYYAISNGSSELPKYVWSSSEPYLQAVSSSWDENISAGKYSITMTYSKISDKLGVKVGLDTEIKVLSRTEGDRVSQIKIGDKTFTGVKVRSLLGLRSADFTITKTDTGVKITTHGFGHGVGMSQYGANGAAKAGYTYKQILNHYYSGASLVSL